MLLNNPFINDSRSWKIASSLAANGWRVVVVARAAPGQPAREMRRGFEVVRIPQPVALAWLPTPRLPASDPPPDAGAARPGAAAAVARLAGRPVQAVRYLLLTRAWARAVAAVVPGADVWQAEGLITLPVALRLRRQLGGVVVYDSRDVHVESAGFARLPRIWRRLLRVAERGWARAADAVVTANAPFADHLSASLGVDAAVVHNGPVAFEPPEPPVRRFHSVLGLPEQMRVALIVSAIAPHRGIEEACDAIAAVPDAVLVIIGAGPAKSRLVERARHLPHGDRIRFLDAVPPDEISAWTAAADVAVMPIQPSTLNHRLTTPTRLFDAMGACVPVVASDLPGIGGIVREVGCGVLCDPTEPMAIADAVRDVLDATPEQRQRWRQAGLDAARGRYAWERQVQRLIEVYRAAGVGRAAGA